MQASNQAVQRSRNRSLILRSVQEARQISRVDLSRLTGLKKSSITNIVTELLVEGLILEGEAGSSSAAGGRKPIFLSVNGRHSAFVGLSVQPGRYRAVVMDLAGQVVLRQQGSFTAEGPGPFATAMNRLVAELRPAWTDLGIPVRGVCVGIPGYVDPFQRRIRHSIPFSLQEEGFPVLPSLGTIPLVFENDARCCTWSELLRTPPHRLGDFLSIYVDLPGANGDSRRVEGVAIGVGLFLNGAIHYGRDGGVGEFRSHAWQPGHRSQFGINDEDLALLPKEPSMLARVIREIDENLIPLASVLSPERIVFFGQAEAVLDDLAHPRDSRLKLAFSTLNLPEVRMEISPLGDEAIAFGAAAKLQVLLFHGDQYGMGTHPGVPGWAQLLGG